MPQFNLVPRMCAAHPCLPIIALPPDISSKGSLSDARTAEPVPARMSRAHPWHHTKATNHLLRVGHIQVKSLTTRSILDMFVLHNMWSGVQNYAEKAENTLMFHRHLRGTGDGSCTYLVQNRGGETGSRKMCSGATTPAQSLLGATGI